MFLGGMMIVFTYASSLSGIFKFYIPLFKNITLLVGSLIIAYRLVFRPIKSWESSYNVSVAYSTEGAWLIFIRVLLILASLFTVVKLISVSDGPLKV